MEITVSQACRLLQKSKEDFDRYIQVNKKRVRNGTVRFLTIFNLKS